MHGNDKFLFSDQSVLVSVSDVQIKFTGLEIYFTRRTSLDHLNFILGKLIQAF